MKSPDGNARLGDAAHPVQYTLDLHLDPDVDLLRGEARITVALATATRHVNLHGEGLRIHRATARTAAGRAVDLQPVLGQHGALRLDAPEALPAGRLCLDLSWTSPIGRVPEGLYGVRADDASYLFTQFEPLGARRAFPCFDEPGFKAPFSVSVRAPRGCTVLANTPAVGRRADGEDLVWVFEETPPLPTYLVAFAVGPFDVVEADPALTPVPLRVITTRGRGRLARHALQITPRLLKALEAWTGVPYPYGKLDLVGVPDFAAGAMENVGLITFRERLLLLDHERAPLHDRMWAEIVIAHELAHMWFGNLVTMAWWDELWLNEAFATHLETLAVQAVSPHYEVALEAVRETGRVMGHDALAQARAIRQPIEDGGDVFNAFDAITYGKGAAVVQMVAAWLGEDVFRAGVRRYLHQHAHSVASTRDLLAALEAEAGRPVEPVLRGFLDQPGVPQVALSPVPGDRRRWRYTVRRHRPAGAADTSGRWVVPVCVRWVDDLGRSATHHAELANPEGELVLPAPAAWLHPNDGERGYYRWRLPAAELTAVAQASTSRLSAAERVALPGHLWALLEAEQLEAADWCTVAQAMAADEHRLVIEAIVDGLGQLDAAVRDPQRAAWIAWVGRLLRPHADRLGTRPRADEATNARLARPIVLRALADLAQDRPTVLALAQMGQAVLRDFRRADPEQVALALPIAAWAPAPGVMERLRAALEVAPTPAHRQAVITALGSQREPAACERGFEAFFWPAVRAQDLFTFLRPASQRPATRARLARWLDRRYDAVVEKVGSETAAHLPRLWAKAADRAERDQVATLFESSQRRPPGGERILRQVLEGIDRNIRLTRWARASLERFLPHVKRPDGV